MKTVLLYGDSGTGKTTLAATTALLPEYAPVLLIDMERGATSAEGLPELTITRPTTPAEFEKLIEAISSRGKYRDLDTTRFKTIILDSVSELSTVVAQNAAEQRANSTDKANRTNKFLFEMTDYGLARNYILYYLRMLNKAPVNVIVTALASQKPHPRLGTVIRPSAYGQLAEELPALYDGVFYMVLRRDKESKAITRRVYIQDDKAVTKVRIPAKAILGGYSCPNSLVNPKIEDLFKIMEGK